MKTPRVRFVAGTLLMMIASVAFTRDFPAEEAQIRSVYAATAKAIHAADAQGAMAGYADDVLVYDISPPLGVVGREHSIKTYEAFYAATKGPYPLEFENLKVKVIDPTNAYVVGYVEQGFTMKSGEKVSQRIRLTDILEKRNGKWLIVHEHISAPVDMQTGKADFNAPVSGEGKPFEIK